MNLKQTFRRWHRNFQAAGIGCRVGAITEKTSLSRPAVSHHLQILKQAGLLKVRREGTKNYYYFDADMEAMNSLIQMLEHAKQVMAVLPERTNDE